MAKPGTVALRTLGHRPRLYVILDGANSDGILNDVSEGGAALDIWWAELAGEDVIVDFEMLEIGQHFEAKARIKWRDEALNKSWRALRGHAGSVTQSAEEVAVALKWRLRSRRSQRYYRTLTAKTLHENNDRATPSPNGQPSGDDRWR